MAKVEAAITLMHTLPTWCLLIDKERKVVDYNSIAEENGALEGILCYEAIAERCDTCPWCVLDGIFERNIIRSCAVELGYDEEQGFIVEAGGMIRDAHWLHVNAECFLHFGFLGLCSFEDQSESLERIKRFMGQDEIPAHTLECIEATSKQFFSA